MAVTTVVGIDVGAPSKGYHAVALSEGTVTAKFQSCVLTEMAEWCNECGAEVVAIDAPCRWRLHGGPARAAEREMAATRISCFSTPTEEKARGHAFYTWMFAGQELYSALAATHPIYSREQPRRPRVCIETFPQAVACALAGELVSAKTKLAVRREVLIRAGVEVAGLNTIDEIDAALCALTAERFAQDRFKAHGDAAGGFIIVPSEPVLGFDGSAFRGAMRVKSEVAGQVKAPGLSTRESAAGRTTVIGYTNRNGQIVEQRTELPGNDHLQRIYVLRCAACEHRYGGNGSDIFQRKCPKCQRGRPGLRFKVGS
jgi:predicted nuclease with RNAse H fold